MEILNQTEVFTNQDFLDFVFPICLVLGVVMLFCVIASVLGNDFEAVAIFSIASIIPLTIAYLMWDHVSAQHTEYEVIVTDYDEVYEKGYEIVEQRGKITIIKEATE